MQRTCAMLTAVLLMLVAASAVYAGGPVQCGHGVVLWSPDTLSRHDKKPQTITITYIQPCDDSGAPNGCAGGEFSIKVDNITSNEEPPVAKGCKSDARKEPDYTGIGNSNAVLGTEPIAVATTVQVWAERCDGGNGRIYTIHVSCIEHGEQPGKAALRVTVPRD